MLRRSLSLHAASGSTAAALLGAMTLTMALALPAKASTGVSEPLRSAVALKDGRRLSYLEWGSAAHPVLLLLHGKASNAAESARFAEELARRFHVYAVDTRGCGFSDWVANGDYSVEATVEDLDQFVAAMRWRKLIVYGHSLGAVTGIAFAARNAAAVDLLLLEDGGPTTLPDGRIPALNPGQSSVAGAPAPAPAEQSFATWEDMVAAQSSARGVPTALMLEARYVRGADGRVRRRADAMGWWKTARGAAFEQPWPLVRQLAMPTLLIRADRGLVPEAIAQEMVQVNPRIEAVTVSDSGHGVHFDQPAEVLRQIDVFLHRHPHGR